MFGIARRLATGVRVMEQVSQNWGEVGGGATGWQLRRGLGEDIGDGGEGEGEGEGTGRGGWVELSGSGLGVGVTALGMALEADKCLLGGWRGLPMSPSSPSRGHPRCPALAYRIKTIWGWYGL